MTGIIPIGSERRYTLSIYSTTTLLFFISIRVCSRVVGVVYMCVNGFMILGMDLSSPDDGYFMYDFRPMSGQQSDKKAIPGILCLYVRLKKLDRA